MIRSNLRILLFSCIAAFSIIIFLHWTKSYMILEDEPSTEQEHRSSESETEVVVTLGNGVEEEEFQFGHVQDPADLANFISQTNIELIEEIRNNWLKPPPGLPLNYTPPADAAKQDADKYAVKSLHKWVLHAFKNKRNGFFIECGAFDGIWLSNTLHLEQEFGWKGLLVEADPDYYGRLMTRNRNAWTINACLGIHPVPEKINITHEIGGDALSVISEIEPEFQNKNSTIQVEVQCFPLASILAALGQTLNVDYMSLDVEGAELKILQTVPWSYVYIKVINLEASGARIKPVVRFLQNQGYLYAGNVHGPWINDHVFIHKLYLKEANLKLPSANNVK